jgi:xanthine dehydrogenase molybdenum-binding subunit
MYQGEPILAVAAVDELTARKRSKNEIDMEPLPFVIDPLDSLRPGGPNPREDGNVWVRPEPPPAPIRSLTELKWTEADFADYDQGRLPMGKRREWTYGDIDAGFKNAALILDESFVTPDVSHQCLEPRTAMAYWQNGKLYLHTGTQSTFQTVPAIARWMNMKPTDIVFISEYTGGGFGSKITGSITMIIPAVLSRKLNAPVMMRISREEEHYIGRARPSVMGRVKVGFAKDGRITALDMYTVTNAGSYGVRATAARRRGLFRCSISRRRCAGAASR